MNYGYNSFNPWQFIILVLIVLQWMLNPSTDPNNLVNNGGLFIIALFGLVMCYCLSTPQVVYVPVQRRRSWFLF
jgi:FtsH-binding integral membrane protein